MHNPGKEEIIFTSTFKYAHWIHTVSEFQSKHLSLVHHLPELVWEIQRQENIISCKKSQYMLLNEVKHHISGSNGMSKS